MPISLVVRSARAFPSTRIHPRGSSERQALKLSVTRSGQTTTSEHFDQEIYRQRTPLNTDPNDPDPPYGPIQSLIVCLKTPNTLSALSQLKHRISPDSVIALLQNGMGVYDELCVKLWPEPKTRPFFLLGTTTHGVTPSSTRGQVTHMSRRGEGDIKWGMVPDPRNEVDLEEWVYGRRVSDTPVLSSPSSPTLPLPPCPSSRTDLSNLHSTLSALLSLPNLNSTLLPMPHLHHTLLLKLALNANINPLTAILGAGSLPNGSLIGSSPSHRLIRMLSTETSSIITAYLANLHAPSSPPVDLVRLYSRENLISRTLALCNATARNSSSMAVDASKGRMTEIDYINGYLISLGDRLGVPTPHHQMVREMVKFTSEVSGLKAETWASDAKRVAKRQEQISASAQDHRSAVDAAFTRDRIVHPTNDDGKTEMDLRSERRRAEKRAARAWRKKRRALESAAEAEKTSGTLWQTGVPGEQRPSTGSADSAVAESRLSSLNDQAADGQPDEEQDEAIRAIESRILGGLGRAGRRGF